MPQSLHTAELLGVMSLLELDYNLCLLIITTAFAIPSRGYNVPLALRKSKIVYSFGFFECNRDI